VAIDERQEINFEDMCEDSERKISQFKVAYIHKAIVEEQAEEGGSHSRCLANSGFQLGFDPGEDVGTRF